VRRGETREAFRVGFTQFLGAALLWAGAVLLLGLAAYLLDRAHRRSSNPCIGS
jgi:hypothetical protein